MKALNIFKIGIFAVIGALAIAGCGDDSKNSGTSSTPRGLFAKNFSVSTPDKLEGVWEMSRLEDGDSLKVRMGFDGKIVSVDLQCDIEGETLYASGSSGYSLGTDPFSNKPTIKFEQPINEKETKNGNSCFINVPGEQELVYTLSGLTMVISDVFDSATLKKIGDL